MLKKEALNQLLFIMEGRILKESTSLNGKLLWKKLFDPYVVEPHALWMVNHFFSNIPHTDTEALIVSKDAL